MKKSICRFVFVAVALGACATVQAQVYECTDANGRKVFQGVPCAAGLKPVDTLKSAVSSPKFKVGNWEMKSQKFAGDPLVAVGPPMVRMLCLKEGFLSELAVANKQMTETLIGGTCKEKSAKLTSTVWRGTYSCQASSNIIEMNYEMNFEGSSMYGATDGVAISQGKTAKMQYKLSGQWLKPC